MKKKFNIFNFILKIGYDLLCVVCVLISAIIVMQKITDNNGSLAGYRMFTVVSRKYGA